MRSSATWVIFSLHHVDLTEVKNVWAMAMRRSIAAGHSGSRFEAGEFDVAKIFYSKFENVVTQIPTACSRSSPRPSRTPKK